jgi:hypothetical protein
MGHAFDKRSGDSRDAACGRLSKKWLGPYNGTVIAFSLTS